MLTIDDIMVEPPMDEMDPSALFGTTGSVELEIGCGKGGFLLSRALHRPDVCLLGIEWANKYYKHAADRMARRQVENVRVMRTDASVFVCRHLRPSCISVLHIYHPDPWPKTRHHKRRLIRPEFVAAATRCLVPGGRLMFQSDHAEYFETALSALTAHGALSPITWEKANADAGDDWSGTNFEIKYARKGRTIRRQAFQRVF